MIRGQVAAVGEEAARVAGCHGPPGLPDGRAAGCVGPGLAAPELGLQLREALLDRVQVRRVPGQEPQLSPAGFDRRARRVAVVGAQVVGDDDLAGAQGRGQDLVDVRLERGAVQRAVQQQAGPEAVQRQGGDQGAVLAAPARDAPDGALTAWPTGVAAGQAAVAAGLVEPDPAPGLEPGRPGPPGLPGRLLPWPLLSRPPHLHSSACSLTALPRGRPMLTRPRPPGLWTSSIG